MHNGNGLQRSANAALEAFPTPSDACCSRCLEFASLYIHVGHTFGRILGPRSSRDIPSLAGFRISIGPKGCV